MKDHGARLATAVYSLLIEDSIQPPLEAWHIWLDLQVFTRFFGQASLHVFAFEEGLKRLLLEGTGTDRPVYRSITCGVTVLETIIIICGGRYEGIQ